MRGDLTLAATGGYRVLHVRNNLIIDGGGSVLDIGNRAQLFVDTNVSLTLRNMTIRNGPHSLATPAIKLGSLTSQLTLDNVNLELGADYKFTGGSLFIANDVVVTGTSAFIYASPYRSYIAPFGTWYFDYGTTLSVAPVTFTLDRSYVLDPLHLNDFISMPDATARLFLNGASLMTTTTGLRLKQGTLLLDNKVSFNSQAERQLVGLSKIVPDALVAGFPYALAWSPDGRYIAVVNYSAANLQVFSFNGMTLTLVGTIATSGDVDSVEWSPDNRFIAVADYMAQVLEIYSFAGQGALSLVGVAPTAGPLNDVAWSPDCRYVAVVNDNPVNTLQIFAFNGQTINLVGSVATDLAPSAADWTPDGGYIVVVNYQSNTGQIFVVTDPTNPFLYVDVPTDANPYDIHVSPDGLYAAIACYGALTLQIFSPSGEVGSPITVGNTPSGVGWSPTGRYIAVPCNFDNTLSVYRFDPGGTAQLIGVPIATGSGPFAGYWSPDGNAVAVVCSNDNLLQIFTANYGSNTGIQAWSNAINFGDGANGSAYDLNVRMLSGARVLITGQVCDDSA
jgi:WD40 repeat protein